MNKEAKNFKEFANTREAGAEKIAGNAKEKGGLALLTWHHFKVKLPYYKKAAAGKFDLKEAEKEFKETYSKISTKMSQIDFQREVGRLEVLGELIIKNEGSAKVNESKAMNFSDFVNESNSKLKSELKGNNYEMVSGIADILKKVKDKKNRIEIAKSMVAQFKRENIKFDYDIFLKMLS